MSLATSPNLGGSDKGREKQGWEAHISYGPESVKFMSEV